MKLNQIIAIEKTVKSRVYAAISNLHKIAQKSDLFNGLSRTYEPVDEDGEQLPPERKIVQCRAEEVVEQFAAANSEYFDVVCKKDVANMDAEAPIRVDGEEITPPLPVTHLLFLEKQITDWRTFVLALPVLDDSETWEYDDASGLHRSEQVRTHKTRKVQRPLVLYPATEQHPAQTQMVTEDVTAGHWTQRKSSGALPKPRKDALVARADRVLRAVKEAREEANMADVPLASRTAGLMTYLSRREI